MVVLGLDLATVTGFAQGPVDGVPASGSVRLKRRDDPVEVAAFNMLAFLRDRFVLSKPDLVCVESYLNPAGHKSADAIILQLMIYGVAAATCASYGVRFESAAPSTIRKHFIGAANAGDRAKTKAAVLRQCRLLKYLPHGCNDDNRADALAAWDWAAATFGKRRPASLALFGQETSA